jgi:dual specificity protein kinase YAK1
VRWLPINTPTGFTVLASISKPDPAHDSPTPERRTPNGGSATPIREDSPVVATTSGVVETYSRCNPEGPFSRFHREDSRPRGRALTDPSDPALNDGWDNCNHDYILSVNDVLEDGVAQKRYKILDLLGSGTFGQVVKCVDSKSGETVAVKVVKNKPSYYRQALSEVQMLRILTEHQTGRDRHAITMTSEFLCNNHLCMVFEA